MTPIPAKITSVLVEGLRNDVVVTNNLSKTLFPHVQPLDYSSAIGAVIQDLYQGRIDTSWSGAGDVPGAAEGLVRLESRQGAVTATPANVFKVLAGIGGVRGWFFPNWTWRLRGMADRLLGGAGLRRGRPPSRQPSRR